MKVYEIDGVQWHLADEGLLEIVKDFSGEDEVRRGYASYPYKKGRVFVKSFREKGLTGFVRNRVLPRGKKEYAAAERLLSFSIPAPKPLGYGITAAGSYIVEEWLPGESLAARLKEGGDRPSLLMGLALLLKGLKEHHVRHNDLHLDNILVVDGTLNLIDLHKMRIKRRFGRADEVSNLSHALVSLYNDMEEDELDAFFSAYGSSVVRGAVEAACGRLMARWFRKKRQRAFTGTSRITAAGGRLYVAGVEEKAAGGFVETIKRDKKVRVDRHSDHIR